MNRRLLVTGVWLGVGFGVWNLLHTLLFPLAEDTIPALLMFYGPMFTAWAITAFIAARRTGRIVEGIKAGMIVAFVTGVVFDLMMMVRVNLFLETLTARSDWRNLMREFRISGIESLRTFINIHYLTQAPVKILVGATIGTVMGILGGIVGGAFARART